MIVRHSRSGKLAVMPINGSDDDASFMGRFERLGELPRDRGALVEGDRTHRQALRKV
jgi:hypothetical protein